MNLRVYTLLLLLFCAGSAGAQGKKLLIGLTRGEAGHVIEYDLAEEKLISPVVATGNARPWYNDLIQSSNGALYGMMESGGSFNKGILFSYDPLTDAFNPLHSFGATAMAPASPYGSLIEVDGKLYGMTESGGEHNLGTIFSFDPSSPTTPPVVLHSFNGLQGRSPYGTLLHTDGKLYGVTESGGTDDFGTIFSFNLSEAATPRFSVLHHFRLTSGRPLDGRSPYGSLIKVGTQLYGTAQFGGANGYGVIFSIGLTGGFSKIADFNWTNGAWPNSTLVDIGGTLYGTAESGGPNTATEHIGLSSYGVIYSYTPGGNIAPLFKFSGNETNGRTPYGKLLLASDGKLYGLTFRGGTQDKGVLYSFNPSGNTFDKKVDFTGANGMNPAASLVEYTLPTPLPLTLLSFTARAENSKVQLLWDVEREFDIVRFEVEHSTDGIHFKPIGQVAAVNSHNRHQYSFADMQPAGGYNYYRLKIIEKYKAAHYSEIKAVNRGKAVFAVTVQPNPVTSGSSIHLSLQVKNRVQITLYNAQGVRIKQWAAATLDKGEHDLPLQLDGVANGSYILVVEAGKNRQAVRVVKNSNN